MTIRNGKIFIPASSLLKVYHGSKKPWEILRNSGIGILVEAGAINGKVVYRTLEKNENPSLPVLGIELSDGTRYFTDWTRKFVISNAIAREPFYVKELLINGLPPIVVETYSMKEARRGI